ncbi:hypothetical protein ANCDUO_21802 [Ancylostoma duodenale]|uniref:Uncharacterized protein n=1 Tax=Ancylostoma duodenale TaxID=51022 RepID=A0A0C2CE50_9BILA|nr:hypothetical protein ANCDUO_21802 [Ancylostoma duodenale]
MMPRVSYIKAMDIYLDSMSSTDGYANAFLTLNTCRINSEYVTVPVADMEDSYIPDVQKEGFGKGFVDSLYIDFRTVHL